MTMPRAVMRAWDRIKGFTLRAVGKESVENTGATLTVRAAGSDRTEILLYSEIGYFGITAERFVAALNAVSTRAIDLRINSPGGDVFDGLAIANAMRAHPSRITVYIDGIAASIASIIALAGDRVKIADNAFLMIHNPWTIALGDAREFRTVADVLDKFTLSLAGEYVKKSGAKLETITAQMDAETWFSAQEALDAGLVDAIEGEADTATAAAFDLSIYARAPQALKASTLRAEVDERTGERPTTRELEKVLRDAGLTRAEARQMVSVAQYKHDPKSNTSTQDSSTHATRDADEATAKIARELLADLNREPHNGNRQHQAA